MMNALIPIHSIQSKGSELDELVKEMGVSGLSKYEVTAIQESIIRFLSNMRDDISVIKELHYVDKVYRDSYYDYYSTKLRFYNRNCIRLSFFDKGINSDFLLDNEQNIKENYLGFLVLRPQQRCIGRNVINPKAIKVADPLNICKVYVDSSCYGIKLEATGFPHASQDSETMTCAQTTIWMMMEYFGNKYSCYHPTTSSEIEKTLTPFEYERQLPSHGLTYNQVSVALREFGLGTKIYGLPISANDSQKQHFYELLACYIESGVPLAIALTNKNHDGHAVVCVGRESIEKKKVIEQSQTIGGIKIFSWNDAVAHSRFVFNDDNFPCYQLDYLFEPCNRYTRTSRPDLATMKIQQFIAPLYERVYLEADIAMSQAKQIVTKYICNCNECVVRTLLTSSRTFREHIVHIKSFDNDQRKALLEIPMPKFIWLTEVSTLDQFYHDKVRAILLIDATGSPKCDVSKNMVLMLADGRYFYFDDSKREIVDKKTTFAKEFEAFTGNLKQ